MTETPNGLDSENFVKVLRDVAKVTVKKEQKLMLVGAADTLSKALLDLYGKPTPVAMRAANAAWARAQRVFDLVDDLPDTDGGARARIAA